MTKKEKLVDRLKRQPKDFSYQELKSILKSFGYNEENVGKSSGSRVAWINPDTKHILRLHKPHPGNILKRYQLSQILDELDKEGLL